MDIDFWFIQKMKRGDEAAFDVFVRRYYEEILKYCSYHCVDASHVKDLTQETFLRFFEKLPEQFTSRILGVAASLFIILIVPELWKNRTCQAMEIEAAAYYSLRQIYAARMLLFGIVDVVFLTTFCVLTTAAMNILFSQLLVQFLFPMVVTAGICFRILCSKYAFSETTAIMMCIMWNAIWLIVILNEKLYAAITFPLWITLIGIAFLFLIVTIYQTLHSCNDYWEVNVNGACIK